MERARHQRLLAGLSLGLLALVAELAGRSLTHRLDVGRHVGRVSYAHAEYYPFLLAAREGRRRADARAASPGASRRRTPPRGPRTGSRPRSARGHRAPPRVRIELSPRLWLLSFVGTASIYLVQADAERAGRRPLDAARRRGCTAPRCRSSPCSRCSSPSSSARSAAGSPTTRASPPTRSRTRAGSPRRRCRRLRRTRCSDSRAPRSLFGLAFESRPPPLPRVAAGARPRRSCTSSAEEERT